MSAEGRERAGQALEGYSPRCEIRREGIAGGDAAGEEIDGGGCSSGCMAARAGVISGAKMSTSGGLINRDLEQMSKINGEITFFLR